MTKFPDVPRLFETPEVARRCAAQPCKIAESPEVGQAAYVLNRRLPAPHDPNLLAADQLGSGDVRYHTYLPMCPVDASRPELIPSLK